MYMTPKDINSRPWTIMPVTEWPTGNDLLGKLVDCVNKHKRIRPLFIDAKTEHFNSQEAQVCPQAQCILPSGAGAFLFPGHHSFQGIKASGAS